MIFHAAMARNLSFPPSPLLSFPPCPFPLSASLLLSSTPDHPDSDLHPLPTLSLDPQPLSLDPEPLSLDPALHSSPTNLCIQDFGPRGQEREWGK